MIYNLRKSEINKFNRRDAYRLACSDCPLKLIGLSGRILKTQFKGQICHRNEWAKFKIYIFQTYETIGRTREYIMKRGTILYNTLQKINTNKISI